jgi:hypothetical protein
LPEFDALIMGHRDKTRFLDPTVKSSVFLPLADVAATIMIDSKVDGVWKMRKKGKKWELELSPFKDFSDEEKELVRGEVEGLRRFTGFDIEEAWVEAS